MFKKLLILPLVFNFQVYSFDEVTKQGSSYKPYFEVLLDRIEEVFNDGSLVDLSALKVRKVNKTRAFVGEVIVKSPMGNDILVEGAGYIKQGGEYRLMPYRVAPTPFCDFCAKDKYVYPDFVKASNFPEDMAANCPIEPKTYFLNGVVFLCENIPKAVMQSGDYAGELSYKKGGKLLMQLRVYVTINNI